MIEAVFINRSHDLSRSYRSILDALAHPGRIVRFAPMAANNSNLSLEALAVAMTLCDFQTPIWLAEQFRTAATEQYLRFHTGAPLTKTPSDAAFAFADSTLGVHELAKFSVGTHEYPDRSTTVIIQAPVLSHEIGVGLQGPGIERDQHFRVTGLGEEFWQQMIVIHQNFPLGIDVIFVAPGAIAAIPRSTDIRLLDVV